MTASKLFSDPDEANPQTRILYINNKRFAEIMGVSMRTAQKWRSMGLLPYSKFRGRVYYKVSDVNHLLDSYSSKLIYQLPR